MAAGESQKQLLSLIRSFASEKSQEELRVSDLKKRLLDLENDLNAANATLDEAKRAREAAEQELRGSQVQLSVIGASIQAQEVRIALLQGEMFKHRSDLDGLKNEEGVERDEFIKRMCEVNTKIRQFQEMTVKAFKKEQLGQLSSDNDLQTGKIISKAQELATHDIVKDLEDKTTCLRIQMNALEKEYQNERHNHDKVCEELGHIERRCFLVTAIMEETKQLQELAGQTTELEKVHASLGEELQRMCTCPICGLNNIESGGN